MSDNLIMNQAFTQKVISEQKTIKENNKNIQEDKLIESLYTHQKLGSEMDENKEERFTKQKNILKDILLQKQQSKLMLLDSEIIENERIEQVSAQLESNALTAKQAKKLRKQKKAKQGSKERKERLKMYTDEIAELDRIQEGDFDALKAFELNMLRKEKYQENVQKPEEDIYEATRIKYELLKRKHVVHSADRIICNTKDESLIKDALIKAGINSFKSYSNGEVMPLENAVASDYGYSVYIVNPISNTLESVEDLSEAIKMRKGKKQERVNIMIKTPNGVLIPVEKIDGKQDSEQDNFYKPEAFTSYVLNKLDQLGNSDEVQDMKKKIQEDPDWIGGFDSQLKKLKENASLDNNQNNIIKLLSSIGEHKLDKANELMNKENERKKKEEEERKKKEEEERKKKEEEERKKKEEEERKKKEEEERKKKEEEERKKKEEEERKKKEEEERKKKENEQEGVIRAKVDEKNWLNDDQKRIHNALVAAGVESFLCDKGGMPLPLGKAVCKADGYSVYIINREKDCLDPVDSLDDAFETRTKDGNRAPIIIKTPAGAVVPIGVRMDADESKVEDVTERFYSTLTFNEYLDDMIFVSKIDEFVNKEDPLYDKLVEMKKQIKQNPNWIGLYADDLKKLISNITISSNAVDNLKILSSVADILVKESQKLDDELYEQKKKEDINKKIEAERIKEEKAKNKVEEIKKAKESFKENLKEQLENLRLNNILEEMTDTEENDTEEDYIVNYCQISMLDDYRGAFENDKTDLDNAIKVALETFIETGKLISFNIMLPGAISLTVSPLENFNGIGVNTQYHHKSIVNRLEELRPNEYDSWKHKLDECVANKGQEEKDKAALRFEEIKILMNKLIDYSNNMNNRYDIEKELNPQNKQALKNFYIDANTLYNIVDETYKEYGLEKDDFKKAITFIGTYGDGLYKCTGLVEFNYDKDGEKISEDEYLPVYDQRAIEITKLAKEAIAKRAEDAKKAEESKKAKAAKKSGSSGRTVHRENREAADEY